MSAAQEAYDRLVAARRVRSQSEIDDEAKEGVSERLRARIKRRLPKVW